MRALFINTSEPVCGVHQYGENLYEVLKPSDRVHWDYYAGASAPPMVTLARFDMIVYNWQALVGGWMASAPIKHMGKQVLCYHDCTLNEEGWDAILFSDPTMASHGKWHSIGRPIPEFKITTPRLNLTEPIVGVHGFMGAWADYVVDQVVKEFEYATVRLHLPYSRFCDADGTQARIFAGHCVEKLVKHPGINLIISHGFMSQPSLLQWLSQNTINCYFRPKEMHWHGVSSALDSALAVRKPIAVSRCNAFRHVHGLNPSICIEDSSLVEIIRNGLSPLIPLYQKWRPEEVRKQVEEILLKL